MKLKLDHGILCIVLLVSFYSCSCKNNVTDYESGGRWTQEKANQWFEKTGWKSGCDYIPSTAINQIEMWQAETFDTATINKEFMWAEELGFTTMRVFLSSVVWEREAESFKERINCFLDIAAEHGITPFFVFFDDCWAPQSAIGQQPNPKPGVHNSGWVRDPADSPRADTTILFPFLESYLKDIMTTFANDDRVLFWDLYNEPGNSGYDIKSLPLLKNAFRWAREAKPSQPITAGVWYFGCRELSRFMLENSDIISYHNYLDSASHVTWIDFLKMYDRPMYCTEYMARRNDSRFGNILPLLRENNIGAINWGFVSGKTNTIFAWDEPRPDVPEPPLWFHDIYRQDKTPFDQGEIEIIKQMNGKLSPVLK